MAKEFQVVIDCANPDKLAHFWAEALGYILDPPPQGFSTWIEALKAYNIPEELWDSRSAVVDPERKRPRIFFQKVPEGKVAKNRLHLDIRVVKSPQDPIDERKAQIEPEVTRLTALGAKELYRLEEGPDYFVTLADPEGNEFCLT
jgi:Glyoxalase-like domain